MRRRCFCKYNTSSIRNDALSVIANISFESIHYNYMSKNADWLEKVLKENDPIPKLVTVVNPGNPSGAFIPRPMLEVISLHKH